MVTALRKALLRNLKQGLTVVGANLSTDALHQLQMVINYMKVGNWMRDHDFHFEQKVRGRTEVFDVVAERVRDRRVLYVELGVFEGASMRYWSNALRHPEAMLHGFDSFEGLPEDFDFRGRYTKGAFSLGGAIPVIDDPRVRFFKGWFQDTLPKYQVPEHEVLVINFDADLYSSTILGLNHLRPWIRAGTYIYFDELSRVEHEPCAFDEFMEQTGLRFRPVVADYSLNTAFFECVG